MAYNEDVYVKLAKKNSVSWLYCDFLLSLPIE